MWIEKCATEDILRTWIKHCPAQTLVGTLDGKILWANAAFCEWSQYTLGELIHQTWMDISVPDKNLDADISEMQTLDAYRPCYVVKKQYIPKGSKPEWGILTVMRYPLSGDIQCCLCTWEPLKNGTATAFALAMEKSDEINKRLELMAADIQIKKSQSVSERLWDTVGEWAMQNPKVAIVVLLILLALNPAPIVITWVTRMGWLPAQPVQIEVKDRETGEVHEASEQLINALQQKQSNLVTSR